jgi:signal transduction histidine kinase
MIRLRLRTKLVLLLIFTTAVVTGASLLVVQNYLRDHAKREIIAQIPNALELFRQHAEQRQKLLLQSAALSADLPIVRAMMTTDHAGTIQDASADVWKLTDWDLFVLSDPAGRLMAIHSSTGSFDREVARISLARTLSNQHTRDWWFEGGDLYEVFLQPIYQGPGTVRGFLATGFKLDDRFTATVKRLTSSDVAFRRGKSVIRSSLAANKEQELAGQEFGTEALSALARDVLLGGENFVAASIALAPATDPPVTLTVLKSYDEATSFLRNVNQLLLGVGLVALLAGSILVFLISHTLTRPIARLASGVAALEKGDFSYPLSGARNDEVGELIVAFDTMRRSLKESQRSLLHAERLATIGRMASTVSHDLRHPLTTILAYAELLSEGNLDEEERGDLYRQIRLSVNNMAELIASLLEFSKAQEALQLAYGDCVETLQDTIRTVKLRPEFSRIQLALLHEGETQGWFDFAKLDRVFHNLLRNACEAVPSDAGRVRVVAIGANNRVEISVSDNGAGIPEEIRDDLFQPFVTFGKADGTGLGLSVVQKIVRDHGGEVAVESTGPHGTTFKVMLPVIPISRSPVA